MAHKLGDRLRETSTTTGTGTYTLLGAVSGNQAFSAVLATNDTVWYCATLGSDWEVGIGTLASSTTLARTTILGSSNGGAAVNWAAGTKDIFGVLPAQAMRNVREPGGRLTLTSATPVLTADVAGATSVFYTPDKDNIVPIYDGSTWTNREFAELTNVLANTATGNAGPDATNAKPYDLFVWDNAGTLTLTRGPAWTSDTARAAGGGLTTIGGLKVNTTVITNGPGASRGTWVGTSRGNAAATTLSVLFGGAGTGGSQAWFGIWNAYNRRTGAFWTMENTASWTPATTRALNNSTGHRVSMIRGADEDAVDAIVIADAKAASTQNVFVGIGLDATTGTARQIWGATGNTLDVDITAKYSGLPGLGFHFLQALESISAGTNTIFGGGFYAGFSGTLRY